MRVLVVAWPCVHSGGAERWWYYVLSELRKMSSFYYLIAIPLSLNRGCYKCPKKLNSSNMSIVYMKSGPISWAKTLIKVIRERRIDIVICGYQTPRLVLATLLSSILTGRRHFTMFHFPIGWTPYTQGVKLSKRIKLLIKLYKFLNRLSRFIFCSPSVIYDLKRVHLNIERFCSVKGSAVRKPISIAYHRHEDRDIDLVYLASISRAKGVYDIPLILKKIKERIQNIRMVIIGRMPDNLRKEIEELLKAHDVKDCVKILGYVDEVEKFKVLAKSKVMIYPSYIDTFAISVLEALTMGTPVIAYAIPAIVINYKTDAVIKVPIGSIDEMAKRAVEILSNVQYYQELSMKAIDYASTYTWNDIARDLLACIIRIE
uniref:Glycosyltransferase n=1 Tax=Ignisphaera aggregans TaxID=334771 RepID=A0A7C4BCS6_9CREN